MNEACMTLKGLLVEPLQDGTAAMLFKRQASFRTLQDRKAGKVNL